ncbi:hypothetical protein GIY23_05925 [Allosaccharopolyspora coralli]|uniref:Uncharacterized protein n=1 Tax=Allosaccharopolyspora coralli TaxID=2665642 RepID=A0A5Q3QCD4_9PSEU|nr:hypothetical protein [Allosaccharopolyspora coralli]QGK69135.1 hypothetical protein GIY23_05925 [Allosaccharopolyspora coralli]
MSVAFQVGLCVFVGVVTVSLTVSTWRANGTNDRASLLSHSAMLIALVAFARVHVWWSAVPVVVWFAVVLCAAVGVFGAVLRWADLPWLRETKRKRRIADVGLTVVVATVATTALATA